MSLIVDIRKKFKGFNLDVSFRTDGERLGILGPSGSGKTMTLKMIAGIEHPDEGFISLNGRTLFDSAGKINVSPQLRKVGYLFQQYALFPNMTVRGNIECGIWQTEKSGRRAIVDGMLARFHIKDLEHRYPHQLSGGQQQRVALARCLAAGPELVLLDEPFSALDAHLREQVTLEMKSYLNHFAGESIMVSHNRDEIYALSTNLMVLNQGGAIGYGSTKSLFQNPKSVGVAQLTGCKNISPIQRLDQHRFIASDWGIQLRTNDPISDETTHVGIRAHDIHPTVPGHDFSQSEFNEFDCEIQQIQEGLFENTILILPTTTTNHPLWWKVDRHMQLNAETKSTPSRFIVRPESLMMLVDETIK